METYQPVLRFPEFKENWKLSKIGKLGTFYYGKSAPKWSVTEDSTTPCVRYGELYSKFDVIIDKIYSYTNIDPSELKFSKGGEILIPRVGEDPLEFAKCCLLTLPNVAIGEMISVYNTDQVGLFITYYFNATCKEKFAKVVEGGNVSNLYFKYLEDIDVCYPSKEEQLKIADFLIKVDKKISQLLKKKELLEQYKKGILQQIFNKEIRFKDNKGNNYKNWSKTYLGEIAKITTGSSNRIDSNLNGQYTFFDRSQDIRTSNKFLFDTEAIIVPGEGQEFIPKYYEGKFDLHQRTYAVMDFNEHIGKFLFYSISYNSHHLNSHAVGSTVKSLRLPMFEKMPIEIPCREEQIKIANFLTSIDNKINQVNTQLDNTKKFKKGLLQQMFV